MKLQAFVRSNKAKHDYRALSKYEGLILDTLVGLMSRVTRKPIFGVADQVLHKRGFTATEDC